MVVELLESPSPAVRQAAAAAICSLAATWWASFKAKLPKILNECMWDVMSRRGTPGHWCFCDKT